jgi:DNA-binding transcriptional regulator YdaS (Cro superfamily)
MRPFVEAPASGETLARLNGELSGRRRLPPAILPLIESLIAGEVGC